MFGKDEYFIFSGTSHPELAKAIAEHLGKKVGKLEISTFPDGETSVQVNESVRGHDVFVVQTIALEPNNLLMELLIMIEALKRASAKSVTAVIPYYGYCRQDRKDKARVPITAKLVATLLEAAGVSRVLTMDLHAAQVQGFFDVPVDDLHAQHHLVHGLNPFKLDNVVVVAPDAGSTKLARNLGAYLGVDFAVVDKHRSSATEVETTMVIGNVAGKDILLADDIASTLETMTSAAKACQEKGAKRIFALATHGLLVGSAVLKLEASPIEALVVSDTIPSTSRLDGSSKIHTVSVASLFADAIKRMRSPKSILNI